MIAGNTKSCKFSRLSFRPSPTLNSILTMWWVAIENVVKKKESCMICTTRSIHLKSFSFRFGLLLLSGIAIGALIVVWLRLYPTPFGWLYTFNLSCAIVLLSFKQLVSFGSTLLASFLSMTILHHFTLGDTTAFVTTWTQIGRNQMKIISKRNVEFWFESWDHIITGCKHINGWITVRITSNVVNASMFFLLVNMWDNRNRTVPQNRPPVYKRYFHWIIIFLHYT